MKNIFIFFFFLFAFSFCKVDPKINLPGNAVKEIIPEGFPQPVYTFTENKLSEDKFQLGRALFYDPILSKDSSTSCSGCHQNFAAFANDDHAVSHGINGLTGKRNAPALFNLNWLPYFMHDGGVTSIELQPLAPISNPIEMAEELNHVLLKLQRSSRYRILFSKAYGSEEINSQKMLRAIAQFQGTLYSYQSRFDKYKRGESGGVLSAQERNGYNLFLKNCNMCHREPLFSDYVFRSNGLSVNVQYKDSGRAHITHLSSDIYKYKTPSLRNVEKSGPYMHDGRYNTLQQCLDHYTNNITNLQNLDPLLQAGLPLSAQDKTDIISFLLTLTDTTFINNNKYKDPKFY